MSTLYQDNRAMTNQIMHDLISAEVQAKAYVAHLNNLQNELRSVKTKKEFAHVVQNLIALEKNIEQFLTEKTHGSGQELMPKITADLAHMSHCKNMIRLLNYSGLASKDTSATKEKSSQNELLKNLNAEQVAAAMAYITVLRELKPIAELLNTQKKQFQERLEYAESLDAIDAIESEVEAKSKTVDGLLNDLLPYPTDEVVAGKLIDFLKENNHLMNVLQSFDMEELLIDDIPNARAAMSANSDNRLR
jgi:hypothetical protein